MSVANMMICVVAVPILAGLLAYCLPRALERQTRWLALLVAAVVFALCIGLYVHARHSEPFGWSEGPDLYGWGQGAGNVHLLGWPLLELDSLAALILLAVGVLGLAVTVYSARFFRREDVSERTYCGHVLLAIGATCGIVMSAHTAALALFWLLLSVPTLLLLYSRPASDPAKTRNALIIVVVTNVLLVFGVCAVHAKGHAEHLFALPESLGSLAGTDWIVWAATACLLLAALAKAGGFPFHSWMAAASESAPAPAAALMVGSLDRLVGIYLFIRVFQSFYRLPDALRVVCMLVGAATILFAAAAALRQHNLRRVLGLDAASQTGYMIIGIASGTTVGIVGGLFHAINCAICVPCLFLAAGAAERKTGETELDRMGGLATKMPLVFLSALIAAAAISGVPPFNGFASKWMVYTGIIEARTLGPVWVVVLIAALFGTALTLASFVKVIHSVFLGQPKTPAREGDGPGFLMNLPMVVLALLCVVLGVGAVRIGVNLLVLPAVGRSTFETAGFAALWSPGGATILICLALLGGLLIYAVTRLSKRARTDKPYVGGETGDRAKDFNFEGVEFYRTLTDAFALRRRTVTFVVSLVLWCLVIVPIRPGGAADWPGLLLGAAVALVFAVVFADIIATDPAKCLNPVRWFWLVVSIPAFVCWWLVSAARVIALLVRPGVRVACASANVKTRFRAGGPRPALAFFIAATPGTLGVKVTDDGTVHLSFLAAEGSDAVRAARRTVCGFEDWIERIVG